MNFQNLLVPHDFSPDSEAALSAAIDLAKGLDATLHLLHVCQRPIEVLSPYGVAVPAPMMDEIRAAAAQHMESVAARAREAGITVNSLVREGAAAEQIALTAEEIGADLLVMGTRGRTGFHHVLLGSVTERTVRIAPCPVLTVKADATD